MMSTVWVGRPFFWNMERLRWEAGPGASKDCGSLFLGRCLSSDATSNPRIIISVLPFFIFFMKTIEMTNLIDRSSYRYLGDKCLLNMFGI